MHAIPAIPAACPHRPIYDKQIQIGFNIAFGASQSGSYDGRAVLANGYTYTAGNAGTTITQTGTMSCSNIYCHGSTMAPNNGTDTTPVWDQPSTASCGSCHGATSGNPPLSGSHSTHVMSIEWSYAPNNVPPFNNYIYGRNLACTVCHNGYTSKHVNGKTDWSFDSGTYSWLSRALYKSSSSGSASPVAGVYGQCTNLYCHSIIQTSTGGPLSGLPGEYKAPTWGNQSQGNCGTCHGVDAGHAYWAGLPDTTPEIRTGSHTKHLEIIGLNAGLGATPGGPGRCAVCHNYVGSDGLLGCASVCHNRGELHVNGQIDSCLCAEVRRQRRAIQAIRCRVTDLEAARTPIVMEIIRERTERISCLGPVRRSDMRLVPWGYERRAPGKRQP